MTPFRSYTPARTRFHWTTDLALSGAVPFLGALLVLATVPRAAYETESPWVALPTLAAIVAPMLGFYWYAMRRMDATCVELAAEDRAQADAAHEARMRAIRGES